MQPAIQPAAARNPACDRTLAARRTVQVGAVFTAVYTASNHLTSLRSDIGRGLFDWEHAIPFVEWTIVPYLSIFALMPLSFFACRDAAALQRHAHRLLLALALAVVAYAAFPLGFQSQRPQPEGPFAMLFGLLWALDLPYNRSPSLHVTVLLLIWPLLVARLAGRWQRLTAHAWLTTIGVSVLTTYQHHVLDIAGGACLAGACVALTGCRVQRAWRAVQVMRSATLPIVAPRRCQNG